MSARSQDSPSPAASAATDDLGAVRTLPELLERRLRLTPSAAAYWAFDDAAGAFTSLSWRDFGDRVGAGGWRWRRKAQQRATGSRSSSRAAWSMWRSTRRRWPRA